MLLLLQPASLPNTICEKYKIEVTPTGGTPGIPHHWILCQQQPLGLPCETQGPSEDRSMKTMPPSLQVGIFRMATVYCNYPEKLLFLKFMYLAFVSINRSWALSSTFIILPFFSVQFFCLRILQVEVQVKGEEPIRFSSVPSKHGRLSPLFTCRILFLKGDNLEFIKV